MRDSPFGHRPRRALSFRQDTSLRETLLSSSWDVVTPAGRRPVAQVTMDHVWLGASDLVPVAAAIYERGNAGVPDESDLTLLGVLLARSGAVVGSL